MSIHIGICPVQSHSDHGPKRAVSDIQHSQVRWIQTAPPGSPLRHHRLQLARVEILLEADELAILKAENVTHLGIEALALDQPFDEVEQAPAFQPAPFQAETLSRRTAGPR